MLGRLASVVIRHPFGVLAAVVVAGAWGAISVNAMWLQDGPHPAPFLGRDALRGVTATLPPQKPERRVSSLSPDSAEEAEQRRVVEKQMAMTRQLQTELAARNFYTGVIDGQYGPRTEAAIRDYERAAGLAETGHPSDALLAHVRLSTLSATPQPAPNPLRPQPESSSTQASAPGGTQTTVALKPAGDPMADLIAKSETPAAATSSTQPAPLPGQRVEPAPLPAASGTATPYAAQPVPQPAPQVPQADSQVQAVQSILADLGYAPGSIDGSLSASTRRAIEDFEVDRGLPMTGSVSPRLLQELTAVSGVPLG